VLRKDLFSIGAGIAGALALGAAAGTSAAFAADTQNQSDADIFEVRGRIAGMIVQLSNLQTDYNGNRQTAINALQNAQNELTNAVDIRGANQRVSDHVLRTASDEITTLVTRLQSDFGDYGGNKVQAITNLQAAQGSINAALATA
jgi:hypothetical protein